MKQIIVNLSDETITKKISSFVSGDKPSCCEEFANSISTYGDGGTYPSVEGVSVQFFELGGKLCFHNINMDGLSYPYGVTLNVNGANVYGKVKATGEFANNEIVYVSPTGEMYRGKLETQTGFDNILSYEGKCDYLYVPDEDDESELIEYPDPNEQYDSEGTPTPTKTPTPSETPTPTIKLPENTISMENIDLQKSGLYNQRQKIASLDEERLINAIDPEKNDFLLLNPYTNAWNFAYHDEVNLTKYPSVFSDGGEGGYDYQVVIALKEPIDILKNTQIYCHFAPVGVDFSNSNGSKNQSTNKVKLFASSEIELNSIQAKSNMWNDCVCCPFYSFYGEHSVGITSAQTDIEDVRYLIFGNMFEGCNDKPNYLARIQAISLIAPEIPTPTPTPTIIKRAVEKESYTDVCFHIMSENQTRWNLVKDQSQNEISVEHINCVVYEESESSLYGQSYIKFDGSNDYLFSDDKQNFDGVHFKNNDFTI